MSDPVSQSTGSRDCFGYLRWTPTSCRRCGYEEADCKCPVGFAAPMKEEPDMPRTTTPAYAGDDMAGFMLKHGFEFPEHRTWGAVCSMTNVRDTAIIVTEYAVFRARPYDQIGFTVELVAHL